jgi:hypothetical protein
MRAAHDLLRPRPDRAHARLALAALACLLCLAAGARAQVVTPTDSAPPRKYVPEELKARLAASKNVKERVKLTLALTEERLNTAAGHTAAERYLEAGNEFGIYQALVDDVILFLRRASPEPRKLRDQFKRVELTLRSHVSRLETMRRMTPSEEAIHIRHCIEFVREARGRALESFFDDDAVLRDTTERKRDEGEGAKKQTPPPPEQTPGEQHD